MMNNPVHPGEILREDVLAQFGLHGHARITPNLAVRLEATGVSTARAWLTMQTAFDLTAVMSHGVPSVKPLSPAV
jgi:antitoxin HigA-1